MRPPLSQDEFLRLQALEQYGVLTSPPDATLDDLVRLAAQICAFPVAGIVLIDGHRQVYKALTGVRICICDEPRGQTPFEATLLANDLVAIRDAYDEVDEVESGDAPCGIALGADSFRSYAGVPLRTPAGVRIGCLFVMDVVARELTKVQAEALSTLSR